FLNERIPGRFGIFGPTASGKTSLILAVASKILVPRVHVDCARTWPFTRAAFYHNLLEALQSNPTGFDYQSNPLEAYANFPAPKKGTRGILVLENAHALYDIDPNLLNELPVLGARVPYHLIVTGEPPTLAQLLPNAVQVPPFSLPTTGGFLERQFGLAGMKITSAAVDTYYEFTRGSPEALQRLGHVTWEHLARQRRQTVDTADVETAVTETVEQLPSHALTAWSSLRGIMRDIFIAMCLYDVESPTEIAKRLDLEAKNVVVLLSRLEVAHRLVDRAERGIYRVRNPLLKHYVRKEWGSPVLR
ncbi:MAG TPA: ATP-binding protein, partial [Candidatus Thermoplasmatota archaeon]